MMKMLHDLRKFQEIELNLLVMGFKGGRIRIGIRMVGS
jgi:hypothetical protein